MKKLLKEFQLNKKTCKNLVNSGNQQERLVNNNQL